MRLTRRRWQEDLPQHSGLRLWIDGTNADLYRSRMIGALDLLSHHAPVPLRWLRATFDVIMVDQLLRIMHKGLDYDYWMRIIAFNPYTIWHTSTEELAIYLVGQATIGRLGRRFRRTPGGRARGSRRALTEMVALAQALPDGAALVEKWQQRLRNYDDTPDGAAA